jgi:hypothetical protein
MEVFYCPLLSTFFCLSHLQLPVVLLLDVKGPSSHP